MRPRRVLHVFNSAGGGSAISTIELIEALREKGIEASAVCHDMGSDDERRHVEDTLRGRVLFTPLYWWNCKSRVAAWKRPILELMQLYATGWRRGAARRVVTFAAREKVDLIHTNTILTPEGGFAAKRLGLPHVWHVRELIGPGAPYRLPIEGPPLGRYLEEHASVVVANSHASAERIAKWMPPELLKVVCNGVATARFTRLQRAPRGDRTIVGMVGNLTAWKNHALFLEAAASVDRTLPVEFHIYGRLPTDRKLTPLTARIVELGLSDRVRLMGFVDDPVTIMSAIDVLVHPSGDESFGRILVEAMAAGLPIVAVRGGGAAEIVVDGVTGLLASQDSASQVAQAVDRLVRDVDLRTSLGAAGRHRAIAQYDLSRCVAEILAIYRIAMTKPLNLLSGFSRVPCP